MTRSLQFGCKSPHSDLTVEEQRSLGIVAARIFGESYATRVLELAEAMVTLVVPSQINDQEEKRELMMPLLWAHPAAE